MKINKLRITGIIQIMDLSGFRIYTVSLYDTVKVNGSFNISLESDEVMIHEDNLDYINDDGPDMTFNRNMYLDVSRPRPNHPSRLWLVPDIFANMARRQGIIFKKP